MGEQGEFDGDVDMRPVIVRLASCDSTSNEDKERFLVREKSFTQQFAAIYFMRLKLMKRTLISTVKARCAHVKICNTTQDISKDAECVIIGTLYKEMALKPCILDEYKDKTVDTKSLPHLRSPEDFLIIEDEDGRVKVRGVDANTLPVADLCTGIVVALRGREGELGVFMVEEVFFPGLPPQERLPPAGHGGGRYAILVSGLQFGEPSHNPLCTQMLVDYVSGFLGGSEDHKLCASIETVIIAGNSLYRDDSSNKIGFKTDRKKENAMVAPLKTLDLLLTQLAASVRVDLMSGSSDPSNYTLPQQPLHPCLFSSARTYSTFRCRSNPCVISCGHTRLLGTAGQPIDDMCRYAAGSRMDHLRHTLEWRILAPTAPDTLACYPFQQTDPFLISECPHVYFAGNQPVFDTALTRGPEGQVVRLVLIPAFYETSTVVLLNLDDLSVIPISFKAPTVV